MARTFNLFISHSWTYGDAYDRLVELLNKRPYFSFKNYSVPKDDPIHKTPNDALLYQAIKQQVSPSHIVIILAGVYATYSKWINKEIRIAQTEFATPKSILAVEPWGAERTSRVVCDNADRIVKWNTDAIVDGIRALVDERLS